MGKYKYYINSKLIGFKFNEKEMIEVSILDTVDLRLFKEGFIILKKNEEFSLIKFKKKLPILVDNFLDTILKNTITQNIIGKKPLVNITSFKYAKKEVNGSEVYYLDDLISNSVYISATNNKTSEKQFSSLNLALKYFISSLNYFKNEISETKEGLDKKLLLKLLHNIDKLRLLRSYISKDADIEYLHDFRVTIRKMRSIIHVLIKLGYKDSLKKLKKSFSDIQRMTNKARELDVLLNENMYEPELSQCFNKTHNEVIKNLRRKRNSIYKKLEKYLTSNSFINVLKNWQNVLEKELDKDKSLDRRKIKSLTQDVIEKYNKKLAESFNNLDNQSTIEELHKIRILCKKLRYFLEYLPDNLKKYSFLFSYKKLKRMQDILGAINDFENQKNYFQSLRRNDEEYIKYKGAIEQCFYRLTKSKLEELKFEF